MYRGQKYYGTPKGLISLAYNHQKSRSKKRGHPSPDYTLEELRNKFINDPKFIEIWNVWMSGNRDPWLKPSLDRIDHKKPYTLDNLQVMTWWENNLKGRKEHMKAVRGIHKKTGDIIEAESIKDAYHKTGVSKGNICSCCKGKLKSAGGYVWSYITDNQ
jgi:hypothetical protein